MLEKIPKTEIRARWSGVKSELKQNSLDALIVPLGVHFYYLFGKQGQPSERLIAGIIPQDDDPFIISPAFEKSNVERATGIDDILTWDETDSPYDILVRDLTNRGIGTNIGVDPKFLCPFPQCLIICPHENKFAGLQFAPKAHRPKTCRFAHTFPPPRHGPRKKHPPRQKFPRHSRIPRPR